MNIIPGKPHSLLPEHEAHLPLRVLVVDDHQDNRFLISFFLRSKGMTVFEARDGREAIEMASKEVPDIVLMDLSMPTLDGFEATRTLKTLEGTRHIPVIAVSAHCMDPFQRDKALACGCRECLNKPISLKHLHSVLEMTFESDHPQA